MSRPRRALVACALSVIPLLSLSSAGHAAGGDGEASAAVDLTQLGSLSWGFYDGSVQAKYPNETAQVAASMDQAVNDYNTVARYNQFVPVTYNPGVPTAEANFNGSMAFGGRRSAATAHHEMSHFLGMQPWVDNGGGSWESKCNAGWAGTRALSRMRNYTGDANAGIGCSAGNGHFWDYGLNQDGEWNWLSKGRNAGMVSAMRFDMGFADASQLADLDTRVVSRSGTQVAADADLTNGGATVAVRSTVARQQVWTMSFDNGFVRFRNVASGRYLTATNGAATVVGASTPGRASTWEMLPTTRGYFQLRNQAVNQCLRSPAAGAALTVVGCDTNPESGDATLQWHLAAVPAAPVSTPVPTATPKPVVTPTPTPVPTATPKPVVTPTPTPTTRTGALVGVASGRCIDVPFTLFGNPSMRLYGCSGGTSQRWTTTASREIRTPGGRCLEALNGGRANGTALIVRGCTGAASQKWDFRADGSIVGADSGLCVDAKGLGTANGTQVWLWACLGAANQRWSWR